MEAAQTSAVCNRVLGDMMENDDWSNFVKACNSVHNGVSVQTICDQANVARVQVWKWTGPKGSGIILTEILEGEFWGSLNVIGLAGKGFIAVLDDIKASLAQFALTNNCRYITGSIKRPGFERLYEALGAKEIYRVWGMEIGGA